MSKIKRFKQFLVNVKNNITDYVKRLISRLGFGKTTKINLSKMNERVSAGLQSQLGYYSEYVTAQEIIKLLNQDKLSVALNGNKNGAYSKITKKVNDYRKIILSKDANIEDELVSQEQQGAKMGRVIYNDAIATSSDLIMLHFNVVLTGDSLKGENKADVVVEITKQNTKEVVDNIMASLKSYKGWSINLANNTLTSFFDNLGVKLDQKVYNQLKHLQSVRHDVWKFYMNDDFAGLKQSFGVKVANEAKPMFNVKYKIKAKPTAEQKQYVKNAHDVIQKNISNFFVAQFEKEYKKNKKAINKKILVLLGFDGSDDFYLAVKQKEKISVLSNRTSDKYKVLIEQIQKDFDLVITYNENAPSVVKIDFYDVNGVKLLSSNISIGQTGSVGQSRTNWWVDFKPFKGDAV